MKRGMVAVWLLLSILVLGACGQGNSQPMETICPQEPPTSRTPKFRITMAVPAEAQEAPAFSQEYSTVYTGEHLTITTQILESENLDALLRDLTGRGEQDLTCITTWQGTMPRHDLTWTCAGEQGMQVCRSTVLDDGLHYYVVTAMVEEDHAQQYRQRIAQCLGTVGLTQATQTNPVAEEQNPEGKP